MKVLFAGGGTGGHLYPGIAMADALRERWPGTEVSFAGTERGIEATEVPRHGYRLHLLRVRGLKRGFSLLDIAANLQVVAEFLGAMQHALQLVRSDKPDVVVGTGGFVSAPVLAAAIMLRKKTLLQEQNAFPGLTTRLLGRFASEVHLSFQESRRFFRRKEGIYVTGNPSRSFPEVDRAEARRAFGLDSARPTLLVFGGSRGARSINNAVRSWLADGELDVNLIWQTGSLDYPVLQKEFSSSGCMWIGPYIDNMRMAYGAADLVLCRAGASTLAELCNLGKPAVLIPYPFAAANHQYFNAEALAGEGAALCISDADVALSSTRTSVFSLLRDEEALRGMAQRSLARGNPAATDILAGRIGRLATMS